MKTSRFRVKTETVAKTKSEAVERRKNLKPFGDATGDRGNDGITTWGNADDIERRFFWRGFFRGQLYRLRFCSGYRRFGGWFRRRGFQAGRLRRREFVIQKIDINTYRC